MSGNTQIGLCLIEKHCCSDCQSCMRSNRWKPDVDVLFRSLLPELESEGKGS